VINRIGKDAEGTGEDTKVKEGIRGESEVIKETGENTEGIDKINMYGKQNKPVQSLL